MSRIPLGPLGYLTSAPAVREYNRAKYCPPCDRAYSTGHDYAEKKVYEEIESYMIGDAVYDHGTIYMLHKNNRFYPITRDDVADGLHLSYIKLFDEKNNKFANIAYRDVIAVYTKPVKNPRYAIQLDY